MQLHETSNKKKFKRDYQPQTRSSHENEFQDLAISLRSGSLKPKFKKQQIIKSDPHWISVETRSGQTVV
jgi:hypothetical protein